MSSYCLNFKKQNTENMNPVVSKTRNGGTMILSKCTKCGTKKSRSITQQEAKEINSSQSYI